MAFTWDRMYKWEENYQRDIDSDVREVVCNYYGVEYIEELSQKQIDEIIAFADDNEYSIMKGGFYNLMNEWEDANG